MISFVSSVHALNLSLGLGVSVWDTRALGLTLFTHSAQISKTSSASRSARLDIDEADPRPCCLSAAKSAPSASSSPAIANKHDKALGLFVFSDQNFPWDPDTRHCRMDFFWGGAAV